MLAIISDVHGNLPALKSVLKKIKKLGCKKIISLGDITGYYSESNKCINLLKSLNANQLMGNHDMYLVDQSIPPKSKLIRFLLEHQIKSVSKDNIKFLKSLKSYFTEDNMSFVHGGWRDNLNEYLYEIEEKNLVGDYKFFFSGRTHVQKIIKFKKKTYCNPGSVGQPRDGNPKAAFATIENNIIYLHIG